MRKLTALPAAKRSLVLLLLMCALALAAAACGDDGNDADADEGDAAGDAGGDDEAAGGDDEGGDEGDSDGGGDAAEIEGETLTLAVHVAAGGGYDWYARTFAREFEERLGINVVVSNEPGAGGAIAYNNTFNASPDEPRIQLGGADSFILQALGEGEGVHWDPSQSPFIGRAASETQLLAAPVDAPYDTFEDVVDASEDVRFATTGVGSGAYIMANALAKSFGFPAQTVDGFDGSGEGTTALLRGEVDFFPISAGTLIPGIQDGDLKPVGVVSFERNEEFEELADTQAVSEVPAEDEDTQQILDALLAAQELHRSMWASPNLPDEWLEALRGAYDEAVQDEEFQAIFEEEGRDLHPMSGEEADALVEDIWNSGPAVKEAYVEILSGGE